MGFAKGGIIAPIDFQGALVRNKMKFYDVPKGTLGIVTKFWKDSGLCDIEWLDLPRPEVVHHERHSTSVEIVWSRKDTKVWNMARAYGAGMSDLANIINQTSSSIKKLGGAMKDLEKKLDVVEVRLSEGEVWFKD